MKNWTALEKKDLKRGEWIAEWNVLNGEKIDRCEWMVEAMYPAYFWDHAAAFQVSTKIIAYESVGVPEHSNPINQNGLYLEDKIIQQLRAVKGTMRIKVHRGVILQIPEFHERECDCKEKASFSYEAGLLKTNIYHLEVFKNNQSITQLASSLDAFKYTAPPDACYACRKDFRRVVLRVQENVDDLFDGLCLDCMDTTKENRSFVVSHHILDDMSLRLEYSASEKLLDRSRMLGGWDYLYDSGKKSLPWEKYQV